MLLQMSKRVYDGTWCWLQSNKGDKIGMHFHPYPNKACAVILDEKPRITGPVVVMHELAALERRRRVRKFRMPK